MGYKEKIQIDRIPRHVAIIMDGNGRWAKRQGLARMFGANLKAEYDAMTDDRDKIVERVIILVEAGQL